MYNKVIETIKKFNMLNNGENVVVGLSGGADSCALTHILARLSEKMELQCILRAYNGGSYKPRHKGRRSGKRRKVGGGILPQIEY